MHLSPREVDKLALHAAGSLAQKRLARGVRRFIASVLLELIRDGPDGANFGVANLMDVGRRILGKRHVLPAVAHVLHEVQVEGTFVDGTKLVTNDARHGRRRPRAGAARERERLFSAGRCRSIDQPREAI